MTGTDLATDPELARKRESEGDSYLAKVVKLKSPEMVSLYLFIDNVFVGSGVPKDARLVLFVLMRILTPVYLVLVRRREGLKLLWGAGVVPFAAFFAWTLSIRWLEAWLR